MARKIGPMIRGFGSALDLAEQLGWAGPANGRKRALAADAPTTTVPELGEMIDVSVYALQDMLTILGLYGGPKDGNWSNDVMAALERWNAPDAAGAARFVLTVIPKADDPQTVSFRRQVFDALRVDAEHAMGRAPKPWYFWPLVITGTVAGIFLVVHLFKQARGGGTSEFSTKRSRKRLSESSELE